MVKTVWNLLDIISKLILFLFVKEINNRQSVMTDTIRIILYDKLNKVFDKQTWRNLMKEDIYWWHLFYGLIYVFKFLWEHGTTSV